MPTISFSGLSSGIDTSGWVDALVSVKQQTITTLQEQQEAQEALLNVVNEIKSYFSSFQSCLEKLTDSQFGIPSMDLFMQNLAVSSNTNIATATATTEAARQSYDVAVDSLATATKATSGYTQYETKYATLDTQIGLLGAKNGTITVNQQSFSVTTEDTIRSLIQKFQDVGVSAAFDGQKGTFTVGVSLSEIDEGATNIKSALKLQDSTVSGAISGSLVYADRDTEFSKLGLTDGKVIIEGVEHTIAQNGTNYTIAKSGGTAANLNTVGDFLDYLMSSAVGAESADVDDMGNISINGATLDSVTGGSNIIDILNLSETFNRTAMESNRLTYIDVHVADLNTKLSDMGINAATTLTVGGNTHNITQDMTLGDVQNLLAAGNVDFDIDDKGVITIDTKGNEISGTLLDVLGLDPSKNGSTITSTAHESHYDADGDTLLSDLGINNSYNYVAYDSEGKALTGNVNNVANKTIDELIADLRNAGLEVEFDDTTHQLVIKDGYIEGTLADALGMSKNTTSYTESATGNTTLEKLGATGNETLTIDGGAAKTYGKDTTLETVLNDIKAAGADVTFKDGNVTIQGVTLGGTLPALLGLDATTQGTSVTSGTLTVVTDSSASGSDMDATIEHDISLSSKIGDILGTSSNYTLSVDGGTTTTYTKDTTLQTLKNQIEAAGGKFTINDDNTISIEDVTMSGTLVGALGFDSVEDGTRFSTVNPVYIPGATTVANGSTSLDELFGGASGISTFSAAPARMAAPAAAPRAGGYTLSIDGGTEISYANGVTLDDIFADIIAAGGSASIDADGYIVIDGVHLEGTLVDALGLVETSYGTTITSGNLEVTESMTSTSSSVLMGEKEGNLSWSSTVGSITGDDKSYLLGINGTTHSYNTDVTLTDIKNDIVAAGGSMTLNSDNTISITGVAIDGTLAAALGFDVTDYKTTISSNTPIYAKTEDVEADASTTFNDLGINTNLRDYAIYLPDGTVVKASSTTGSSGTATIGDWLNQINNALNTANGTSGKTYAKIENGIISITGGGYVTGSLPTALGMLTEEVITGTTMVGSPISYIEYEPLKYITSIQNGKGESGKDITYTGSINNATNQSGTAADAVTSDGLIGPEDEFVDLFGNITDATLDATLSELLTPGASDPLNNDARLPANSYTLKIGSYATKTFDSDTTTLQDVIDYIDNLKVYDPTYDMAFDAYLSGNKLVLKTDMDISGTLADVIGLTKVKTEDEYYTYVAKNIKYTAVVEGASNGFNFSIVGDKVYYDKTEIGNKDGYEYTGEIISSSETVSDSDGFITTPDNVTGDSGTTITVDPDGFITNPDIHNPPAGGGGSTSKTEYYYQGSSINAVTESTSTAYASSSTKLVDLFGSDVIGKTIVINNTAGQHDNGIVEPDLNGGFSGPNTGVSSGPSLGDSYGFQHTGNITGSKTITIAADTTLADISVSVGAGRINYSSTTGKITVSTSNWTDGCGALIAGTFLDYLNSELGLALGTTETNPNDSTYKHNTRTWQTDKITTPTTSTVVASLSTTVSEIMSYNNSGFGSLVTDLVVTNNGSRSTLSFNGSDTLQDVIDELKGLGLSVTYNLGKLRVSSTSSDFKIDFTTESSGHTLTNLFALKLFGGSEPVLNEKEKFIDSNAITSDTTLGELGITSGTLGNGFRPVGQDPILTTFTSDNTLGDVIDMLELNGATVTLFTTGKITISSDIEFDGDLLGQLGLTHSNSSAGGGTYDITYSGTLHKVDTGSTSGAQYVSDVSDFVSGNTYLIKSVADLNKLAELVNSGKDTTDVTFILEQDINMSSVSNFAGIGGSNAVFKGNFYGNGHVISNLKISSTSGGPIGFFGITDDATIQDIGLENVTITGAAGALVGYGTNTTIKNSYVDGGTISSQGTSGGLAGYLSNSTITNSWADIDITANSTVGGLVGMLVSSTIEHAFSSGNISGSGNVIGGLVGSASGNIKNVYSTVNISSTASDSNVGGLIGIGSGTITNAYYAGSTLFGTNVGGVLGTMDSGNTTVSNSAFNSAAASSAVSTGSLSGASALTMDQLKNQSTMQGLGFTAAEGWQYTAGATPHFGNVTVTSAPAAKAYVSDVSDFVSGNTYYIKSVTDLNKLAELVNSGKDTTDVTFILEQDINMSSVSNFAGIGGSNAVFKGNFYGNGHVISNLKISSTSGGPIGFFGITDDATIQDIGLENVTITGAAGALVGYGTNTTIKNSYVDGGTISSQGTSGGLAGYLSNSTITNSWADIDITANSTVGGLVGMLVSSTIEHAFSSGNISGSGNVIGGLVGSASGNIKNVYSTVNISSTASDSNVGGLIGIGSGTITNAYYAGSTLFGTNVGGVLGTMDSGNTTVSNSAFNSAAASSAVSTGSLSGASALTMDQLKNQSTMQGLGFTAAEGWQYTAGATPHFGNVTTTNVGFDMSTSTTIGQLFGDSSSHTLTVQVEGGTAKNIACSSTDTVQDVIDKLAAEGIEADVTGDHKFKVFDESRWTLSGEVATKLFGGSGNNVYTYTGNKVTYDETVTVPGGLDSDGFIDSVETKNPSSSGSSSLSGGFIDAANIVGASGNILSKGFIDIVDGYSLPERSKVYVSDVTSLQEGKTYYISTEADLRKLSAMSVDQLPNITLVLENDIDLTSYSGTYTINNIFTGKFYGNGHVIKGLKSEAGGFFNILSGDAVVRDLGLENISVSRSFSSSETNDYVAVGGLANVVQGSVQIINSYTTGSINGSRTGGTGSIASRAVGGLVGKVVGDASNNVIIKSSYSDSSVSGNGMNAGGLIGYMENAVVSRSYTAGKVDLWYSMTSAGGFVGYLKSGEINDSFSIGKVSVIGNLSPTNYDVGGFAGVIDTATINRVYTTQDFGNIYSYNGNYGGFVGNLINAGSITNAISLNNDCTAIGTGVSSSGITSQNLAYMQNTTGTMDNIFNNFNGWEYGPNMTPHFGTLYYEDEPTIKTYISSLSDTDTLEKGKAYYIGSAADLVKMAEILNSDSSGNTSSGVSFILDNDIDMSGINFTMINHFKGNFYGNGHVISNLTIDQTIEENGNISYNDIGLFRIVNGAVIKDLGFENVTFDVENSNIGALAGSAVNSTIDNVYIKGGSINVDSNATWLQIGGLVGYAQETTIKNSYTSKLNIDVAGSETSEIGGLIGAANYSTIEKSYAANNNITSNTQQNLVGGLIGYTGINYSTNAGTIINDAYATGTISTSSAVIDYLGGLIGYVEGGSINDTYTSVDITASGTTEQYVGGMFGYYSLGATADNLVYNSDFGINTTAGSIADSSTITNDRGLAYTGMTDADFMQAYGFYRGTWSYTNGSTPHFGNVAGAASNINLVSDVDTFVAGTDYYIETAADLQQLAYLTNSGVDTTGINFILNADIDMTGESWDGIGLYIGGGSGGYTENYFRGNFYGNGHTISNLHCALFNNVEDAKIQDVGIVDFSSNTSSNYATLVNNAWGNTVIKNTYATGSVTLKYEGASFGGLVASLNDNSILESSYADVDITITDRNTTGNVGGLVLGTSGNVKIKNSYSAGSITVDSSITTYFGSSGGMGGLIGYVNTTLGTLEVSNVYSITDITVDNFKKTGGMGGDSGIGGLIGGYNTADTNGIILNNAYYAGNLSVNTGDGYVGYIFGVVSNYEEVRPATNISNTVYYNNGKGYKAIGTNDGTSQAGVTGLTLDQMQNQSTMESLGFSTANGWVYTADQTPNFGNMTGSAGSTTTVTHDATLNTTVGQLIDGYSSGTITVSGGSNINVTSSTTIQDIIDAFNDQGIIASWNNGKISLESGNTVTIKENNGLISKLFGSTTITLNPISSVAGSYTMDKVTAGTGTTTNTYAMDASTTIGDLFGDSNNHTFTVNGNNITLGSDDTVQDLIDALAGYGVTATIYDGKMTIGSNSDSVLTVSGDLANKVLGKTGSGSVDVDYKTEQRTLSLSSTMSELFWDNNSHDFVITKENGSKVTISLSNDDTIQDLITKLKGNGIVATIDSSGKMTFKSNFKWSVSGDLGNKVTEGVMNLTVTPLYTFESEELEVYTGHQTVSQILNAGGTLIKGNRYHIATVEDLKALATFVNNKGLDTTDIDFVLDGDLDLKNESGLVPIGNSTNAFKGNFYGNGYKISNLNISSTGNRVGLFGWIDGATIRDLRLEKVEISGASHVGALVGYANNATIENVYSTGKVTGSRSQVGGLIGDVNTSNLKNVYSTAEVEGNTNVGGLIGYLGKYSVIENSYATGDVHSSVQAGGLVGGIRYGGTIKNSYATGDVYGTQQNLGGLVGLFEGIDGNYTYILDTVYSTGRVQGTSNTGALVGKLANGAKLTATNAIYNSDLEIAGIGSGSASGLTGLAYVDMQDAARMQGLGFTTAKGWKYISDKMTPVLNSVSVDNSNRVMSGDKTYVRGLTEFEAGDTYYIGTAEDLVRLAELVNAGEDTTGSVFILDGDINMAGIDFAPIGTTIGNPFRGDFYGNGHEISNLSIDSNFTGGYDSVGLFGYLEGAHIQDVGIVDVSITANTATYNSSFVGALVGYAVGASIENVYVLGGSIKSSTSATANTIADIGGLIGSAYQTTIVDSYAAVDLNVTGTGVGGFIGRVEDNTTITNSYSTGTVNNYNASARYVIYTGGFAGWASGGNTSKIESSYATGRVISVNGSAGGFIGCAHGIINNSYATGFVEGSGKVGGFVGEVSILGATLTGNVYNQSTKLNAVGSGSSSGITGLELSQMWEQDRMEGLGFTADKGWLYTDNTTPFLNTNNTMVNGDKTYVRDAQSFDSGEVFYIGTAQDLVHLAELVKNGAVTTGVTFVLDNDIVMTGVDFDPIGTSLDAFKGVFMGNGHTISGLKASLFGYVEEAIIRDVGLENVNSNYGAALVSNIANGRTEITNVYAKGTVTGGSSTGGLVGYIDNSATGTIISDSYAEVNVTGSMSGGLVGVMNTGTIRNSYASGNVTSTSSYGGGLVGNLSNATIENSFASGNVSTRNGTVGGLAGKVSNSTITGSYASGVVTGGKGFIASTAGSNTFSGNVYNNATADTSGAATGISLDEIKRQSVMEDLGFTSDKGWVYYEDQTPQLRGKDTSKQYTVDASLDSILANLGGNSISKDITVEINGTTHTQHFNDTDTVEDVMNWLNGISGVTAAFDETNSQLTVTTDDGEMNITGGLANTLFGGYTNRVYDKITQNTDSSHLMAAGGDAIITENTTVKELLNSNNAASIGFIDEDGNVVMESFDPDQTLGEVIDYLNAHGFNASITNGVFTVVKEDGSKTDIIGAIGSALKGENGTTTTTPSEYVSDVLTSITGEKATGTTQLSALGIDSGTISIQDKNGNIIQNVVINNTMTVNDAAVLLANYGITMSITDGKVTVTTEGPLKLVDGSSNMVSQMQLDNWIENKSKLTNTSTVAEMGFAKGAALGVIINGKTTTISFNANDTLDDIITKLNAMGIEASVDADGKFIATSDNGFVLTDELGTYLTQNSVDGYVEFANGYKSDKPLESPGNSTILTEDSLVGDILGTGEGGILRLTLDENTVVDLQYNADDTMQDIMVDLAAYGIQTQIKNGVLTAVNLDRTFTFSGDIGKAISGNTPLYENIETGYISKDLSYETVETANMNSTMKELGILGGQIHILNSEGGIVTTLDVDESFTVSQIKSMLSPYGFNLTMDANGKVSMTSSEGYSVSDGTSNLADVMGLDNWNQTTEKLALDTTISEMGFKDGADLNLFLDGAVMNVLSFDAEQTLQDVIFALSAYGIDATVDSNGKFSAVSKEHTFIMSSTLGSFLTKGTSGYVNDDTGYQTVETLEEEKPYTVNSSEQLGYEKLMSADSTLASLGYENGGSVIVNLDGDTYYTLSFLGTDTVQDVIYALSPYGITAEVDANGKFNAVSVDHSFTLTGNVGNFLASGGKYQNEVTGYESDPITFETEEKVSLDTKLSSLGITHGDFNIMKDGKVTGASINITDDTTVGQLFNAIKVYGMEGKIMTDTNGETYIQISADSNTYLADGTANIVSGLGLVEIRQGDFEGNVIYWEDDTDSGLITEDMLLSTLDKDGYIAQGSLIFETGTGDEAVQHIINITADETVGSLIKKFRDAGIDASLSNGVIKISSGLDGITFTGGTSGLVNTIGLDIENVDVYASSSSALTYEGDVHYSAANFANGDTLLDIVNATEGDMSIFVDGVKCTIHVDPTKTFADLFAQISSEVAARTGLNIKAGFLDKEGNIVVNPTDDKNTGIIAFEVDEGHELVVGASNDTTNFATIANLNKTGINQITGSRSLYRVNVNSLITESGLYRDGDITEGTFKIGDAEFTIDSTTTLASLIEDINHSQTAYATAYWDTLSGTMVIQSTLTGASLINIEAGTSNFTDIMGFTTVTDTGASALVTSSQTLGKNAVIRINGTTVTATSNVITSDVSRIKGLTINLKDVSEGETVTITVEQDDEAIFNAVSDTIDAYNAMMEALNKELSDKNTLGNEALLKLMRNNLKRLMTSSLSGAYIFKNLAAIGISTGEAQDSITLDVTNLIIDKDKFMNALDTDSDAVKSLLVGSEKNPGIFLQANNIVESSIKSTGYFSNMIDSLTRNIDRIQDKINKTNDEITKYRDRLERQFHNMELTISGLQSAYSAFLN